MSIEFSIGLLLSVHCVFIVWAGRAGGTPWIERMLLYSKYCTYDNVPLPSGRTKNQNNSQGRTFFDENVRLCLTCGE